MGPGKSVRSLEREQVKEKKKKKKNQQHSFTAKVVRKITSIIKAVLHSALYRFS